MMPFTIHPDQKPSDDESLWLAAIAMTQKERDRLAVAECNLHAENVRCARLLGVR